MTTESVLSTSVDPSVFRQIVGHFMSGVTVVTTSYGGERFGVTVSAVSSVSLEPPTLLICLNRGLATADAVAASGRFAVNILAEDHAQLATQFATRHPDKFRGTTVIDGEHGMPVLGDALAYFECRVDDMVAATTHTVFIGRVHSAHANTGRPLAYFRGSFGRFEETNQPVR